MALHKNAYSRQLIDWSALCTTFGNCAMVPMPYSVWTVARKLLQDRALWQSTFYTDAPNLAVYNSPEYTDENWIIWKDELTTFLFDSEEFMTKFDDLLAGQAGIEDAIRDLQEFFRLSGTSGGLSQAGSGAGAGAGILPGNNPGYIDPALTDNQLATGQCNAAQWLWDALYSVCNTLDLILVSLQVVPVLSDVVLLIARSGNAMVDMLPDRLGAIIVQLPAFRLADMIEHLEDDNLKQATLDAMLYGGGYWNEQKIQWAFSWLDDQVDAVAAVFVRVLIEALSVFALDSSKWTNLPDSGECGGEDANVGQIAYTGPTIPPTEGIVYGLQEGAVGSCGVGEGYRYSVYGEANCQMTIDIGGNLYGKTTLTLNYAIYRSAGTATVELRDGSISSSKTAISCNEQLIITRPAGLNNPQIIITSSDTNGVDFWPITIGLS
jgi:hypothetical protein